MMRSSPHLPSSPALGAWRQYRLSNPLGGLVGSKTKSLRPSHWCDARRRAPVEGKLRTRTEQVNATFTRQLDDPDRARDSRRVGRGDILLLRARMVPRIPDPWNLSAALGNRRPAVEDDSTAIEVRTRGFARGHSREWRAAAARIAPRYFSSEKTNGCCTTCLTALPSISAGWNRICFTAS